MVVYPGLPPTCALTVFAICFLVHSSSILPTLLACFIPLTFQHCLPISFINLYDFIFFPGLGMSLVIGMFSVMVLNILSPVNISLCISPGPLLLCLVIFFLIVRFIVLLIITASAAFELCRDTIMVLFCVLYFFQSNPLILFCIHRLGIDLRSSLLCVLLCCWRLLYILNLLHAFCNLGCCIIWLIFVHLILYLGLFLFFCAVLLPLLLCCWPPLFCQFLFFVLILCFWWVL